MKLIGMLDSPYVRRVAISLQLLDLRFAHQSLSVFRTFEHFRAINPVVKAPTLICDDGSTLIDSTLILDYAEALAAPRTLMPRELPARQRELRLIGLALAACEKSVQIVYERDLRPADKQHAPWLERVRSQLQAACAALDAELVAQPLPCTRDDIGQAALTIAVMWEFVRLMTPDDAPAARYPQIVALAAQAEALPEFRAAPFGDGTYPFTPA